MIKVPAVWAQGIFGQGVRVEVNDDGVDPTNLHIGKIALIPAPLVTMKQNTWLAALCTLERQSHLALVRPIHRTVLVP
jgi:hypothetical protein